MTHDYGIHLPTLRKVHLRGSRTYSELDEKGREKSWHYMIKFAACLDNGFCGPVEECSHLDLVTWDSGSASGKDRSTDIVATQLLKRMQTLKQEPPKSE